MGKVTLKNFFDLNPGERFSATLLDIRPGEIRIRFYGGGAYTAKTFVLPNAHIGDECIFAVKENDRNGRIVLEIVREEGGTYKKYDMRV